MYILDPITFRRFILILRNIQASIYMLTIFLVTVSQNGCTTIKPVDVRDMLDRIAWCEISKTLEAGKSPYYTLEIFASDGTMWRNELYTKESRQIWIYNGVQMTNHDGKIFSEEVEGFNKRKKILAFNSMKGEFYDYCGVAAIKGVFCDYYIANEKNFLVRGTEVWIDRSTGLPRRIKQVNDATSVDSFFYGLKSGFILKTSLFDLNNNTPLLLEWMDKSNIEDFEDLDF